MAEPIEEAARAKINLTLQVRGRRDDGYHEIESLVAFALIGDHLVLEPGKARCVTLQGPFAGDIDGTNLVESAMTRLAEAAPALRLGAATLTKNLPVAAGLGGGSADAAALLRAVRRANPAKAAAGVDWDGLARSLGADVPVCLAGVPTMMWGIGERLVPLASPLPHAAVVLANPRLPLSAGEVYRRLGAGPAPQSVPVPHPPPRLGSAAELAAYAALRSNDLEAPAEALCPVIAEVKAALMAQPGALLARMSGSGPTCFALFASQGEADAAAATLARREPGWWVVATQLG